MDAILKRLMETRIRKAILESKEYEKFEDDELVSLAKDGDGDAVDTLIKRYINLIYHIAKDYFASGYDRDDLAQEGLIGFYKSIDTYDPNKGVPFKNYAMKATQMNIVDAVRSTHADKRKTMNDFEDFDELPIASLKDPESSYLDKEGKERLEKYMKDNMTELERNIISAYIKGYKYAEIADKLGRSYKSIENSMASIRRKLTQYKKIMSEAKKFNNQFLAESLINYLQYNY